MRDKVFGQDFGQNSTILSTFHVAKTKIFFARAFGAREMIVPFLVGKRAKKARS